MARSNLHIYTGSRIAPLVASNRGMSIESKTGNHPAERAEEMTRWKRGVVRTATTIVTTIVLCAGLGYVSAKAAQENAGERERDAIQLAVNSSRIDTLTSDQSKILSRLDTIDVRQAVISDRISQVVGIGIGGMGVLSVLSALGIGLTLKRTKPGA